MKAYSSFNGARKQLALACLFASAVPVSVLAAPDLIVINGDVHTVDGTMPRVKAFAVEDGKFTALGTTAEIRALADANTRVVDAEGNTVTPGFIDAHQHFNGAGDSRINLYVQSREEWREAIAAEHERLPEGAWLTAFGWDHTIIDDVLPNKEFLDEIVGDRPVVLTHIDGHFVWINSVVLEMARITADTPVPPGGEIVLDPQTGEPTGILKEGAARLIAGLEPPISDQQRYAQLPEAIAWANSLGITGMHNMSTHDDFLHVLENGDLTLRIWHGPFLSRSGSNVDEAISEVTALRDEVRRRVEASGKESMMGPLFNVGFIKLINDGVLSVHTAVLKDDYVDKPRWRGEWTTDPELLKATVEKVQRAGFQVAIHSIGDDAVRASLDAFAAAAEYKGELPNRIEHVELLDRADLPRFAQLDVVPSMTPNHMTKAVAYIEDRIEPARENRAYIWRSLLDSGAELIFGSDAGTSIHQDPLKQIGDAVYRSNHSGFNGGEAWHGEQALTFAEALHAYTLGPAETTAWGDEVGSISIGKWADFAIVDARVPEPVDRSIFDMAVEATYFAGREVYRKP